ncbi:MULTISPECIES: hypothetical protein [unclassified Clostridioides]|uniref:hypothetical protein n=1 Tax=unclassified Clostridioides TaxID=2635829 RepID=UPI001D0FDCCA|nr:hypothetical protein [Clostridioides sp. ES-S-0049-03]MCC0678231.1 hypothetical protein [Clostridioides sp. ES-W-0018-02]MCC0713027.1 hypothetical protein [Clostridioides sp. ES-W-0017-02]
MLDKIIVAVVDEEEMIFRTELKKLEEGNEVVVFVNGMMKIAIFKRFINKCEDYIKDIAFQKIDTNKYIEALEKEKIRIMKEFKEICDKDNEVIINKEIDGYLRECGFNCISNKFLRNIDEIGISISQQRSGILIEIAHLKKRSANSTIVNDKDIIEIIKVINKNLTFMFESN